MRIIISFLMISLLAISCKKEQQAANNYSEAGYTFEMTGKWVSPDLTVPAGAHFTLLIGMIHNENAWLWRPDHLASVGVEDVAERGDITQLRMDIDLMISAKNARALFLLDPPSPNGHTDENIILNSNFPYFSFETMIAPSPDWLTGLNSLKLYRNGHWVADTTIDLYVYDAGTEQGDIFGYNNPPTIPQQTVSLLSASNGSVLANGNNPILPIASVRLRKL